MLLRSSSLPALSRTARRALSGSCCPLGALPALAADEDRDLDGQVIQLDDVNHYVVAAEGTARGGLIVAYDVFGFSGGRIKSVCDSFAKCGFNVIMPDVYTGTEINGFGGLDGFMSGAEETVGWISAQNPAKYMPMLEGCKAFLAGEMGSANVGGFGLCWGAVPVFHAAGAGIIRAGVSAHPSLQAAGFYGEPGQPGEFAAKTGKCPMLLLPAQEDSLDDYGEEGAVTAAVRDLGFACVSHPFPEMHHGFVARGDTSDAATARDVETALQISADFFAEHL